MFTLAKNFPIQLHDWRATNTISRVHCVQSFTKDLCQPVIYLICMGELKTLRRSNGQDRFLTKVYPNSEEIGLQNASHR